MVKYFLWTIGIFLLLSLSGCNKEGVCLKSTGKTVKESRAAQAFHYLEVNDNINVMLTQDSTQYAITVEAGENLIAGIAADINDGHLVLQNNNTCDWLRSYSVPVNVYLTFKELDTIIFQAAGNISCANTWTNDSIYVNVIEGAGNLHFTVHVGIGTFQIRYGTVSMVLDGKCGVTFISSQGYGPFHAENLVSKFTYIYTFSPNDVYVYAEEELGVEIGNIGNVYYTGNPKTISKNIYGEGKLIQF